MKTWRRRAVIYHKLGALLISVDSEQIHIHISVIYIMLNRCYKKEPCTCCEEGGTVVSIQQLVRKKNN